MSLAEACILALLGACIMLLLWRGSGPPGPEAVRPRDASTVGPAFWLAWGARRRRQPR